jgi:hypothetical protein
MAASRTNTIPGAFDNPSGRTVANVCVQNTSFTGSITNEGTISPSGITFKSGTITGQISSSGTIATASFPRKNKLYQYLIDIFSAKK